MAAFQMAGAGPDRFFRPGHEEHFTAQGFNRILEQLTVPLSLVVRVVLVLAVPEMLQPRESPCCGGGRRRSVRRFVPPPPCPLQLLDGVQDIEPYPAPLHVTSFEKGIGAHGGMSYRELDGLLVEYELAEKPGRRRRGHGAS